MDLSFTKDINYGKRGGEKGYASEDDDERKKVKGPPIGDDDFQSSIISSDDSIAAKINELQSKAEGNGTATNTKKQKRDSKLRVSKEVNKKLKRMLTSDFNKNNDKMNDSQSTFLGNNQSFR